MKDIMVRIRAGGEWSSWQCWGEAPNSRTFVRELRNGASVGVESLALLPNGDRLIKLTPPINRPYYLLVRAMKLTPMPAAYVDPTPTVNLGTGWYGVGA